MTLTLAQHDKIFAGIPYVFGNIMLQKEDSGQFINPPGRSNSPYFPLVTVTFLTEGVPVRPRIRLRTIFDPANQVWHETYGEQCKASISCVLQATSKRQITQLSDLFCHDIAANEISINPYDDAMQFRGVDPPRFLDPYYIETSSGRIAIYRCVVDFFVEYEYSWTYDRPLIKEIDIEKVWTKQWVNGSGGPIDLVSKVNLQSFLLDMILAR